MSDSAKSDAAVNKALGRAVHRQLIPFHDCDPLGIVWHGHYYKYLEIARTKLFAQHRLDVPDFIELGLKMVVIESRCRYAASLRYGDEVEVEAFFKDIEQRLHVAYIVKNLTTGRRSARAWTVLVAMRGDDMLLETPREIIDRLCAPARS